MDLLRLDLVPGRAFLFAAMLPLFAVLVLLLTALLRNLTRSVKHVPGWPSSVYWLLGGDQPHPLGGLLSLACLVGSAGLSVWGSIQFFADTVAAQQGGLVPQAKWAESLEWIQIGPKEYQGWSLRLGYHIDALTALSVCMVTLIGSLIFLFSFGYMKDELQEHREIDRHHPEYGLRRGRFSRFFLYLSLFAFSMLNLLIADNLMQIFICWELVGVCSFFLIGFYYERNSAGNAANKAFLLNRVGDAGFLLALGILFTQLGTLNIKEILQALASPTPPLDDTALTLAGLGLFLGCVGKSAQVPLQTWLPDAMEGPTPVSALIHAATMVAAGVYLVARVHPLFSETVLFTIAVIGMITLFLSATMALVATDIKRILAFSTCSQLGYMMLALGVGGWSAGVLHLITHAVFKALLFLGAGSVIHGLHHEQDLRQMGGLRRKMPVTAYTMLLGVLAISGMPLMSGWASKDLILAEAFHFAEKSGHWLLFLFPLLTATLTAFYMFRLWFLVFAGAPRNPDLVESAHESPRVMTIPLLTLAFFSVTIAWGWPIVDAQSSELGKLVHEAEHQIMLKKPALPEQHDHHHLLIEGLALAAMLVGVIAAYWRYQRHPKVAQTIPNPRGLLGHRWYFDWVYDRVFVVGTLSLARLLALRDRTDTSGVFQPITLDGLASSPAQVSRTAGQWLQAVQTGQVRVYLIVIVMMLVLGLGLLRAFS